MVVAPGTRRHRVGGVNLSFFLRLPLLFIFFDSSRKTSARQHARLSAATWLNMSAETVARWNAIPLSRASESGQSSMKVLVAYSPHPEYTLHASSPSQSHPETEG